jgi:hypothetical protein
MSASFPRFFTAANKRLNGLKRRQHKGMLMRNLTLL